MKEKDIICLELMANIRRGKRKCNVATRHTIASRLWRMCFTPIIVVRKPTRNFRRNFIVTFRLSASLNFLTI